jgi:hypothetical protein
MLLRNMIYSLNANMIGSTASNMIFLLRKSDYSVLAYCSYCEIVEKCFDVTAGIVLLSHKVMSEE